MANCYYYDANGNKIGPIAATEIKALAQQGTITPETVIENADGRSAVARKLQGLVFLEPATSESTPPLADTAPDEADPFTAAMPVVKKAKPSLHAAPAHHVKKAKGLPISLIIGSVLATIIIFFIIFFTFRLAMFYTGVINDALLL